MWRMVRAAATLFPIFHGHRLTLRKALNVVLSRLLPRSPTARSRLWARVERLLQVGELAVLGRFERDGDRVGFAFVAEVGQSPDILADLGEGGQQARVSTQAAGVVFPARGVLGRSIAASRPVRSGPGCSRRGSCASSTTTGRRRA